MAEREEVEYLHWWDRMVASTKHPMVHLSISYLQKHQESLVNDIFSFSFVSVRTLAHLHHSTTKQILCNFQYRMLCKHLSVRLPCSPWYWDCRQAIFCNSQKNWLQHWLPKRKKKGIRPSKCYDLGEQFFYEFCQHEVDWWSKQTHDNHF